jgi:hypothetical protein
MANFNWIRSQVNANATDSSNTAKLNTANVFTAVQSGPAATALNNFPRASQVQDGSLTFLTSVAGTDTITGSLPLSVNAYSGIRYVFMVAAGSNTGAATLNINSIGALAILKNTTSGLAALAANDIRANGGYLLMYDGTQFVLLNPTTVLYASAIGVTVQGYDADTAKLDVAQTWTAAQRGQYSALSSSSNSIAINLALSNNYSHTLSENTTLAAPSNAVAGQSGVIVFMQDSDTAKTLAFNSFWKFASGAPPTISTTLDSINTFSYVVNPGATSATCNMLTRRS